ncbi:MAG: isoleucine--tRNA ligase [Alphaproteobacteria bacterium GM202ARS2]|nr:isoleucine--tRNA ligase [Alphaproteobacteria bacterium GM202ARS2]
MSADSPYHLFLPRTAFPMKAQLPQREPERLQRWQNSSSPSSPSSSTPSGNQKTFVLHDGPPYANGHLHMGHALNKILKDIINRNKAIDGYATPFIPGWDCHGLPIEWQVEQDLKAQGIDKKDMDVLTFRQHCRAHAQRWLDIQKVAFQRLGVSAQWDNAYDTMSPANEAMIAQELSRFLLDGSLYRGVRPVMWSTAEQTALADAEVDYKEHTSTTVVVRFAVQSSPIPELADASALIWTTTPWTLPSNRAIAYGEAIDYVAVRVDSVQKDSLARAGETLLLAEARLALLEQAGIDTYTVVARLPGKQLAGTQAAHPLVQKGYDAAVPLLAADFVDTETGSGLVHIAPGHGEDDFHLGRKHNLEVTEFVQADGCFVPELPLFAGMHVFKANDAVIEALQHQQALLLRGRLRHSYPHSWRSGVPLIFRVTPQWFISMTHNGLRDKALAAIDKVDWHPPAGKTRITSMVAERPDWCISRQRLWGVPLAVFMHKDSGDVLRDKHVVARIVQAMQQDGADAWFAQDPRRFLAPDYSPDDFTYSNDIIDVWFDSGASHAYVLRDNPALKVPADVYLEGSDQHRGWFQSSLLHSCGTRGTAPYEHVVTHGFVLDQKGYKMSKSRGNVLAPQDVMQRFGADVLRLWVATSDSSNDLRMGDAVLQGHVDAYRRLRHCLRFILGNLHQHPPSKTNAAPDLSAYPLERLMLHSLADMEDARTEALAGYRLVGFYNRVVHFCALDLSAFYFDIRKDCLYCDSAHSPKRQATLFVLEQIFMSLLRWLAPVLCFTCDEAWEVYCQQSNRAYEPLHEGIAARGLPPADAGWRDEALSQTWTHIRQVRGVVTSALERAREKKVIGASLDAHVDVYVSEGMNVDVDWAEVAIVSSCALHTGEAPAGAHRVDGVEGVACVVSPHGGVKCPRCWQRHEGGEGALCARCQVAERDYALVGAS